MIEVYKESKAQYNVFVKVIHKNTSGLYILALQARENSTATEKTMQGILFKDAKLVIVWPQLSI